MARQVRFALYLKDEHEVRNSIEEIREYFDYSKVVAYVIDGRLQSWLSRRGYDEEADAIGKLNVEEGNFKEQLCAILGVDAEVTDEDESVVDAKLVARLEYVKQYTADVNVLQNIAKVATNQKELLELVKNNEPEIYLCRGEYVIPLVVENVKYIGIAGPTAIIRSSKPINFTESNIIFENVNFNDEYMKLCEEGLKKQEVKLIENCIEDVNIETSNTDKDEEISELLQYGNMYQDRGDYVSAVQCYRKAAYKDDSYGMYYLGLMYLHGKGVDSNQRMGFAFSWLEKSAKKGNAKGMYYLAICYENGYGITKNWDKALEWYEKSAEAGNEEARNRLSKNTATYKKSKTELRKTDIIAEFLGVLINGKLKNGTVLWTTDGDEELKSHNFPYQKFSDEVVRNFFEHYKGSSDCVIGGLRETNILTSDEYLIFKDYCLISRDCIGKIIQIKYCDIENVSIEGEYDNKLMYTTKTGDKRELDRSYLWNKYVGLYGIRLFLLVMAKICGDCKYQFNDDERMRLLKIRLETLNGESVLEYL